MTKASIEDIVLDTLDLSTIGSHMKRKIPSSQFQSIKFNYSNKPFLRQTKDSTNSSIPYLGIHTHSFKDPPPEVIKEDKNVGVKQQATNPRAWKNTK